VELFSGGLPTELDTVTAVGVEVKVTVKVAVFAPVFVGVAEKV